jgi:hypothetical protein
VWNVKKTVFKIIDRSNFMTTSKISNFFNFEDKFQRTLGNIDTKLHAVNDKGTASKTYKGSIVTRAESMFVGAPLEAGVAIQKCLQSIQQSFGCLTKGTLKVVNKIKPNEKLQKYEAECSSLNDVYKTSIKTFKYSVGAFSSFFVGLISPEANIKFQTYLGLLPSTAKHQAAATSTTTASAAPASTSTTTTTTVSTNNKEEATSENVNIVTAGKNDDDATELEDEDDESDDDTASVGTKEHDQQPVNTATTTALPTAFASPTKEKTTTTTTTPSASNTQQVPAPLPTPTQEKVSTVATNVIAASTNSTTTPSKQLFRPEDNNNNNAVPGTPIKTIGNTSGIVTTPTPPPSHFSIGSPFHNPFSNFQSPFNRGIPPQQQFVPPQTSGSPSKNIPVPNTPQGIQGYIDTNYPGAKLVPSPTKTGATAAVANNNQQ